MATIFQYGQKAADELATATRRGLLAAADFVKLQTLTQADYSNLKLTANPPKARLVRLAAQAIVTATPTALIFDTARYNSFGAASSGVLPWAVGNPTRLVAPVSGYYRASGGVGFVANAAGTLRQAYIQQSTGSIWSLSQVPTGAAQIRLSVSSTFFMNQNEYIELFVQQNTGANLNAAGGTDGDGYLELMWVAG